MRRTAAETALLLAVILARSGQNRARISERTLKLLGKRKRLRSEFISSVKDEIAEAYGWIFTELEAGGFGAVHVKALEAAKAITAKKWLTDNELRALRKDSSFDLSYFEDEIMEDFEDVDDSEG